MLVDVLHSRGAARYQTRLAAGGHDFGLGAKFADQTFENAVDHAQRSIIEARLQTGHGVRSDEPFRLAKCNHGQAGSPAEERCNRDADTGGYNAAEILTSSRNDVEVDRRS